MPRTLRDRVSRENSPVNKFGRNAVLSADVKKQLCQRVAVRRFAVQICEEHSIYNP
jgi:hypothetical protein